MGLAVKLLEGFIIPNKQHDELYMRWGVSQNRISWFLQSNYIRLYDIFCSKVNQYMELDKIDVWASKFCNVVVEELF